jgi:hypothetical protein
LPRYLFVGGAVSDFRDRAQFEMSRNVEMEMTPPAWAK